MKRWCVASLVAAGCSLLVSCATDEQRAIEAGAIQLSQSEIAKVFPGNTIRGKGPRGQLTNYYHKDGRKLNEEANQVTERKWWINDNGQWCETLIVDDSKELCDATIYKDGRSLTWYSEKGAAIGSFLLVTGNPEGFEQPDLKVRPANNTKLPRSSKPSTK